MNVKELFITNVKEYIRPITDMVGIHLEFNGAEPPAGSAYPLEQFGYPITICQGVSAARRMGMTLAFRKEDHACPPQLVVMGYIPESVDTLLEGTVCYPAYAGNMEAAKKIEAANIRLDKAPDSIWIGPYHSIDWEPDIVLVYGNSAQVTRLAQGYAYYTGDGVKSNTLGRLACAGYINKVFVTQEPTIVIPGGGERVFGSTQDDELVFAVPSKFLETTAQGVEAVHKAGYARFPTGFHGVTCKPRMPGKYMKALMPRKD